MAMNNIVAKNMSYIRLLKLNSFSGNHGNERDKRQSFNFARAQVLYTYMIYDDDYDGDNHDDDDDEEEEEEDVADDDGGGDGDSDGEGDELLPVVFHLKSKRLLRPISWSPNPRHSRSTHSCTVISLDNGLRFVLSSSYG